MFGLVSALLWVTTWIMWPTHANGWWTPKAFVWLLGCWLCLAGGFIRPPAYRTPCRQPWLGLLLGYVWWRFALQVLWPQVHLAQTTEAHVRIPWIVSPILPTLICSSSFLVMQWLVTTTTIAWWRRMAQQIRWLTVSLLGYGVLQLAHGDPLHLMAHWVAGYLTLHDPTTVFGNQMVTANFLAITAPLFLVDRKGWHYVSYAVAWGLLGYIRSSVSCGACLVGSLVIWQGRKQWFPCLGALLVSGLGVGFLLWTHQWSAFASTSGRWAIWRMTTAYWWHHARWGGLGLAAIESAASHGFSHWPTLHNEYLQVFVELGLIGGMLMLGAVGFFGGLLRRMQRRPDMLGWVGMGSAYLLIAAGSFPLRIAPLLALGVLIGAALMVGTQGGSYVSA